MLLFFSTQHTYANVIKVVNTLNSGSGSLRSAVLLAAAFDTILIDTKGTITLNSEILFNGKSDITIIGPYPKHNSITPSSGWSGSLFRFENSNRITFQGIGFVGSSGTTRHIYVSNNTDAIGFISCLFENGNLTSGDGGSISTYDAYTKFVNCSFINNSAQEGGAMHFDGNSKSTIINCTFSGNSATDKAGAISIRNTSEVFSYYNTFVLNTAVNQPEVVFGTGGTEIHLENNAVGNNGTKRQINMGGGSASSSGGNKIKLNFSGESIGVVTFAVSDLLGLSLFMGLRPTILVDGYGLKYWPIIDGTSDLINTQAPTILTPSTDCRNAPRSLKGTTALAYPDAGAAEYTHLRVTSTSGNKATPNSFLWTLEAAQRTDDIHFIEFDILSPIDINPLSEGIASDKAYIIDGFTQPGSSIPGPNQIGFSGLTGAVLPINLVNTGAIEDGIQFDTGTEGSILIGVSVQNFTRHGIEINDNEIEIYGCEIGITSAGVENGSNDSGIKVNLDEFVIGGWQHWQRNVISGNGMMGGLENANIYLQTGENGVIFGNIIGLQADGLTALSAPLNTNYGIYLNDKHTAIGSPLVNTGNIICDNNYGIFLSLIGDYNSIQQNKIGVGWDGSTAFGNANTGVFLNGSDYAYIGGSSPSHKNIIAHNNTGIALKFSTTAALNNRILGNSIFQNSNQGIDIDNNNIVVPNDGLVSSFSNNFGLDYPELVLASNCDPTETKITYQLRVPTGVTYRVEFFSNSSPDATNGEGETFLGFQNVTPTTNPQTFAFDLGIILASSTSISATVTSLSTLSTSEFGTNVLVTGGLAGTITYLDVCFGSVATPTIVGDLGGEFSFDGGDPGDGALLDPSTGELSNGVEGTTYSIVYGFEGGCLTEDTATCVIINVDETFTMDEFCPGSTGIAVPVIPGGGFYLVPDPGDAAYIVEDSGILHDGVEGETYTVEYIVAFGGCTDTGYVDVVVTATDATFTLDDFCPIATSAPAVSVEPGGVYSFAIPPGDGATINPSTGAITGGVEYTTYSVKYTVGPCDKEHILDVNVINTEEHFTYNDFCPESIGMPSAIITLGGTFSFAIDDDAAEINPATGFITNGVEGTTYYVIYQVGVCGERDTMPTTVITVNEGFIFDNFCVVADSSGTGPIAETPDFTTFYMLDADDGATINETTGIIYSPQEGTIYTVIDSVFQDGCWQDDTVTVQAILVNETFSMSDICFGEIAYPSVDLVLLDSFFFFVDPAVDDPVSIHPTDGAVSNGTANETYYVRRIAYNEGCADSMDVSFKVILLNTDFSFGEICPGPESPAPIPDVPFGIFSLEFPPLYGESIVSSTGIIMNPYEGASYNVIYTRSDSGCVSADTMTVLATLIEEEFDFADFCWEAGSPGGVPVDPSGTWSFGVPYPGDLVEIDGDDGAITLATEGAVYNIVYTVVSGSCSEQDSMLVTALGVNESFTYPPICVGEPSLPGVPAVSGGTFSFFEPVFDGTTINATTGVLTGALEGSEYVIMYEVFDLTGTCSESSVQTVTVVSLDESFTTANFCAEFDSDMPIPSVTGGEYSLAPDFGDGATIDPTTGIVSSAVPGTTYFIAYTLTSGTCSEVDTNALIAYPSEDASFDLIDHCANIDVEATIAGMTGGTFDFFPDPGDATVIDPLTGLISNSPGNTYSVRYITAGTAETCRDTVINTVEVFVTPQLITLESDKTLYCPEEPIGVIHVADQTDAFKVFWYDNNAGIDALDSTFSFLPSTLNVGENIFYAQAKSVNGCLSEFKPFSLILSDTSGMRAGLDVTVCMGSAVSLEAFGGSTYLWITDVPFADYTIANPIAFSLNEEEYIVRISNTDNCSVYDTVNVTFSPQNECAIEIFNAFSPNDDGTNDFWYIENLINYLPNTVYIYNRWGNEVNQIENYDNLNAYWDGNDLQGKTLPPGTYFYVVITENQLQNQAGWVQLVR